MKISHRTRDAVRSIAIYVGAFVLLTLCVTVILPLVSFGLRERGDNSAVKTRAEVQREEWQALNIQDYEISVTSSNQGYIELELTVRDGAIIQTEQSDASYVIDFERFTVEGLFDQISDCSSGCIADYDEEYFYPTRVGGGYLDNTWLVTVNSFKPLE